MKNRIINIVLNYALNFVFIGILITSGVFLYYERFGAPFFLLFFCVLVFSLLPLVSYARTLIDSFISPASYRDLYVQTVDSILNLQSIDDMLRDTFDQVLDLIRVKSGLLIFYYHDKNEFNIFYQKNKRMRTIRKAKISQDNIIFRVINGPDDIIIKSKLNPSIHFERGIIEELEKLGGEIVVPVYFHDMFFGLIIAGSRTRKFSPNEIRLLKVFASKMAIMSVNSYFFNEIVKKKDLEKEYELASKVQKKFLPKPDVTVGKMQIRVFNETSSLMIREFFDVFINDASEDDVRISAYRILGDISGTSILMPGVQSLLQSYARLGFSPANVVTRLKRIVGEKNFKGEDIGLFHGSLRQNGEFLFRAEGYPAPFIYKKKKAVIRAAYRGKKEQMRAVKMEPGDILLICCDPFSDVLSANMEHYGGIVARNISVPLGKLSGALVKDLSEKIKDADRDRLLILIRMEEPA